MPTSNLKEKYHGIYNCKIKQNFVCIKYGKKVLVCRRNKKTTNVLL